MANRYNETILPLKGSVVMLVMFRVNNFTSFKNDAVLDLRKTSYREHKNHILKVGKHELLKTVSIYGANASGKSNLISSIAVFEDIIRSQFFKEKDDYENEESNEYKFPIKPFIFTDEVNDKIEFEMVFYNEKLFQYGFSIKENIIESEWLLVENELVFDRSGSSIEYGAVYEEILGNYSRFREDRLYVSILDYFVIEDVLRVVINLFKDYFVNKLNLYFEIIFESSIKGRVSGIRLSKKLEEDEDFRLKVSEYLKKIDVGIDDIIVDIETKKSKVTDEEEEKKVIKTVHCIYDSEGNCVGKKALDLQYESSGTLRFLSFIQEILLIMDDGGVFVVDELSSRLHPVLTKFIVDLFQSNVNTNTQLIFTTHDTTLMNKNQFRRDEIVLVDKDDEGISNIYTLSDLEVRKDASFEKEYFNGKYGAIPIIQAFDLLQSGDLNG